MYIYIYICNMCTQAMPAAVAAPPGASCDVPKLHFDFDKRPVAVWCAGAFPHSRLFSAFDHGHSGFSLPGGPFSHH